MLSNTAGFRTTMWMDSGVCSFMLAPDNTATLAEHLGMTLSWGYLGTFGGAAQVIGLQRAVRAIEAGDAETVVLVAADAYSVSAHVSLMDDFNSGMREYLIPYGMGGANGLFATLEQRHRFEYGTKREQLGKLAVTQRQNASLNPNAMLREPMTIDDYLNARVICDPIRLYDCVLPCGGGEAVVVTSVERARTLKRKPVACSRGASAPTTARRRSCCSTPDGTTSRQGCSSRLAWATAT